MILLIHEFRIFLPFYIQNQRERMETISWTNDQKMTIDETSNTAETNWRKSISIK